MNNRFIAPLLLIFSVTTASAAECSFDMPLGVKVEPEKVVLIDAEQERVSFNHEQLLVDGKKIALNTEQQALLSTYENGIRQLVPEMIELVEQAMDVPLSSVSEVLAELGASENSLQQLDRAMAKLRSGLQQKFSKQGDSYYIAAHDQDKFEQEFEQEMESAMAQVMPSIMGNLFSQMGEAMTSGGGDFAERMESFGQRMENLGEEIETKVESNLGGIEQQAESLCGKAQELDKVESQLHQAIPQLQPYPLLKM